MTWAALAAQIAMMLLPLIPQLRPHAKVVTAIASGIGEASQFAGASNADKKAHVLNLVALGADATNTEAGRGVLDIAATQDAASGVIDTIVKLTNLAHAAHGPDLAHPSTAPAGV